MSQTVLTHYNLNIGIKESIQCAVISDLHDRCPDEAIHMLRKLKPDLILVAGDLMERHAYGESEWTVEKMDAWQGISPGRTWFTKMIKALDGSLDTKKKKQHRWNPKHGYVFLKEASKIAPIIMGMGNHEWYYTEKDRVFMKKHGVTLLDNEDTRIQIKGVDLSIGSLSTRYDLKWLKSFADRIESEEQKTQKAVGILICHHPDYYGKYVKDTKEDVFDVVVSGHTHGGQWRWFSKGGVQRGIPVFAPGQGLFPKYAYGRYGKLIVSSGVSNTTRIPRWGNPCEVVLITLH